MNRIDPQDHLPLTSVQFHILLDLCAGARHGYGIKRSVEERTGGVVRLGAGTLYHALGSLRDRNLIAEAPAPEGEAHGSSRWKFYRLTPAGRTVLEAELARLEADVRWARTRMQETAAVKR